MGISTQTSTGTLFVSPGLNFQRSTASTTPSVSPLGPAMITAFLGMPSVPTRTRTRTLPSMPASRAYVGYAGRGATIGTGGVSA